ncbi:Dyp-type peroxidase [Streptomyces sp. NBC_00083]|uniref:Dyp-type peroxidase n=1 Tax=Streptomyces sp. NBC_00083 TaxID=2975647 RepID=UPI00225686A6|nr:Dyp-type peroxidase [Streptomyces sp. NBC_00083]MCX5388193.1 Dyp-type peroxidase [Streptomyces sp. NBC_00083]
MSDSGFRRRTLLATLPVAFAVSGCDAAVPRRPRAERPVQGPPPGPVRQAGVVEPPQRHLLFVSYDLTPGTRGAPGRDAVRRLLARWSELLAGAAPGPTATVGIGPALPGRIGIGAPEALLDLPALAGEHLDAGLGGGEIGVQICARDPQGCERLAGLLAAAGAGVLRPRWRQGAFLPPEGAGPGAGSGGGSGGGAFAPPRDGETPRDLLGFRHGSANPTAAESERWVWLAGPGPYADGTFLVVRRVRLRVAEFGRLPVARQEQIIGRRKRGGEPLGGGREHDPADVNVRTPDGGYVLPADAHVRLADHRLDGGARMLRRAYSYENSAADRGLFLLAYLRDPALFVRVRQRLAAGDALNAYAEQYGSALFYVLPGATEGRPLGSTVL